MYHGGNNPHSTVHADDLDDPVRKCRFCLCHFILKNRILPRRARDKHRKKLKRETFLQATTLQESSFQPAGKKKHGHRLLFCASFGTKKCIILPRRARDKHSESSTQNEGFFSQVLPTRCRPSRTISSHRLVRWDSHAVTTTVK
jgi:hypothetical protein